MRYEFIPSNTNYNVQLFPFPAKKGKCMIAKGNAPKATQIKFT